MIPIGFDIEISSILKNKIVNEIIADLELKLVKNLTFKRKKFYHSMK